MKAICAVLLCWCLSLTVYAVDVPILMYHDFVKDNEPCGEFAVTESRFCEHLAALKEAGYTSVTFEDLINYVDYGLELPDHPIILTTDDGYTGAVELAVPIAEKFGMTISCAVIGKMAGEEGHFSPEHPSVEKMEIISHTFDLHYADEHGFGAERVSGELLAEDCLKMNELALRFPMISKVFVYPYGAYSVQSEEILNELEYRVTVTCDKGTAKIEHGGSLRRLPRIGVYQNMRAEDVLALIQK